MSDDDTVKKERAARWRRRMYIAGAVLALLCKLLPDDYRAVCDALASACTLGL